jgi:hypothetical protein
VKSVKAQSAKNFSQFHSSKLARGNGAHPEPRKTAKDLASGETLPFLGNCVSI